MATKADVLNYMQSNYHFDHVSEDMIKMLFELESGRTQVVYVYVDDFAMAIFSPFGDDSSLNGNLALKLADDAIFGVKKFGELYCLNHVLLAADLDESEIDNGLMLVSNAADELEQSVGGDNY